MPLKKCPICKHYFNKKSHKRIQIGQFWPKKDVDQFFRMHDPDGKLNLKIGSVVCSNHVIGDFKGRFTKKKYKGIKIDFQGHAYVTPSKRKLPARNSTDSASFSDADSIDEKQSKRAKNQKTCLKLIVDDIDTKVYMMGTKNVQLHNQLMADMLPFVSEPKSNRAVFSRRLKLELLLVYYWNGFNFVLLARMANVSEMTIRNIISKTETDLERWAKSQITIPKADQLLHDCLKMHKAEKYKNELHAYVDGTVVRIPNQTDPKFHRATHNQKHGFNAHVVFALVTPRGYAMYVSEPRTGNIHDKTHWDNSDVVELLQDQYPQGKATIDGKTYQMVIGGDKAYPHMRLPDGWQLRVTRTAEKTRNIDENGNAVGDSAGDAPPPNVHFDPDVASYRGVVERFFARCKAYGILNRPIHTRQPKRLKLIFFIISALSNWFLSKQKHIQV